MEDRRKKNQQTLILTITNRCNLNCTYCYESSKNNLQMSLETAKKIILEAFDKTEYDRLEFDFHGGEPLLNFPLIRELCEWTWSEKRSFPYRFFGSTNGTLLNPEIKKWLSDNKDRICLGLSLDGTPEMNLMNRGCVIKDEDIDFFVTNWPSQTIKMTVSKNTIETLSDGIIYAHKKGFGVSVNLAYGIDWDNCLVDIYKRELNKLIDYYIDNPKVQPCSIFEKNLSSMYLTLPNNRCCGAGKQLKAYDTEGNSYPCHMFSPNTLEVEQWYHIMNNDFFTNESIYDDKNCVDCKIYKICPTCYGMNFLERQDIGIRDKRRCPYIKVEKEVLCNYKMKLIMSKKINLITEAEYLELSAVKELLHYFKTSKK